MSNIIQAIGLIVAAFSVICTAYNKVLIKNSIKQATATPNGIFILSISLVIIGLSLIINQASTKSTIGGIAFAIAGVALEISATMWRKDVPNDEADAKAIVNNLNKQHNSQNLWFGYITIPVHSYQDDRPLKERYQDSLDKEINSDLKETF